jgi:hypothetical protein
LLVNFEERGTGGGAMEEFMRRMLKLPMVKTSGLEGRLQVREISHMVAEAMGLVGGFNP